MQAPAAADLLPEPHVVPVNADDAPVLVPLPPPLAVLALPPSLLAVGPGAAFALDVPVSAVTAVQPAESAPASRVTIRGLTLSAVVRSGDPGADPRATDLMLVRRPSAAAAVPVHVGCPSIPVPHDWDTASIFEPNGHAYERRDMAAPAIGTHRAPACLNYIYMCSEFCVYVFDVCTCVCACVSMNVPCVDFNIYHTLLTLIFHCFIYQY